jgi:hypothetical protein
MSPSASHKEAATAAGRPTAASSTRAQIIELNDQLRVTFKGGRVQIMPSIYQLDARLCGRALCVMSRHAKFDRGSDHDRGRFVFAGYAFEWCVEYQNRDGTGVSPDPADPDKTLRVLTLSAVDDVLIRRAALCQPPSRNRNVT